MTVTHLHTCVRAVMCFEVGALRVRFPAADVVTRVRGDALPRPGAPATFGLWFLRQAVAAGDHEGLCGAKRQRQYHTWGQNIQLRHISDSTWRYKVLRFPKWRIVLCFGEHVITLDTLVDVR